MTDLKVVQDWQESGAQVQSALSAVHARCATAEQSRCLAHTQPLNWIRAHDLGVIAIQDESAALASVTDMRWQTLLDQFYRRRC